MRRLVIIVGVIAALVIIAALAVPAFLDVNRYRDRIQAELRERLNRPVTLGKMRLSLLPLAFRVENAVIGEDPRFPGGKPFAQVEQLYVSAKLLPLLRGEVEVRSLELRKPRVELIRNQQGVRNFDSLGKKKAAGAEPQQRELSLANLEILDGQVAITDFKERQPRTVYDHLDLEVSGYAPDREFSLAVAAHLPGEGKQMLKLEGKAGPSAEPPLATPFDGVLRLDQVSLSSLEAFLNSQALRGTNATASGKMDVKNKGGRIASNGSLKLTDLRIRGTDVGYPITADYDLVNDPDADLLTIEKATLKLGSTPISITGTVNTGAKPARIDLR
ncbi:MAG TPA: AsmA family protein, partial [Terriglobales bacterium]|nr:AsmA family protein [Terriglobales bacterium]